MKSSTKRSPTVIDALRKSIHEASPRSSAKDCDATLLAVLKTLVAFGVIRFAVVGEKVVGKYVRQDGEQRT